MSVHIVCFCPECYAKIEETDTCYPYGDACIEAWRAHMHAMQFHLARHRPHYDVRMVAAASLRNRREVGTAVDRIDTW